MQSLIDESVHALFAAVVEQIHKFAQVSSLMAVHSSQHLHVLRLNSLRTVPFSANDTSSLIFFCQAFLTSHQPSNVNVFDALITLKHSTEIFLVTKLWSISIGISVCCSQW